MPEETTIYQDQTIHITNLRAVIEGKTYPIANITSVEMLTQSPSGLLPMVLFIIGGFMVIFSFSDIAERISQLIGGLLMIGVGVLVVRASNPTYIIQLATAAGEVKAMQSTDRDHISKLTEALNQAIIQRG